MGRPIPEIRDRLHELADELGCEELHELAEDTKRNSYKNSRAAPTARKMTNALADEIQDFAEAHPDWSNRKIGRHFGVDGGRVTDAISGKEYDE